MRIIKLMLISFVFFFLLFTAISLLIPSHVRISKAINLISEKETVFSLIRDTTEWKNWHPAFQARSPQQAVPTVILTPILQNDSLFVMNVTNPGRKTIVNGWQMYNYASTDSLTLQWYMDFHLNWYPWEKFGSLFYEKTYGPMMEQGLSTLKALAEKTQ